MAVKAACFCDRGPNAVGLGLQTRAGAGRARSGFSLRSRYNDLNWLKKHQGVTKPV